MTAAELGIACLCGASTFERVIVQRLPTPPVVTDFVACLGCSAMFFRPKADRTGPGSFLAEAKDAAVDYRKPGRSGQRVDEVKDIRDKAEAMAAYARQAKDTELVQWATEIKVRAERKCGEILLTIERDKGGKPSANSSKRETSYQTALRQNNIHPATSARYQQLAAMPAEHFETAVATAKATAGDSNANTSPGATDGGGSGS